MRLSRRSRALLALFALLALWWPAGTAILHALLFHPRADAAVVGALPQDVEEVRYGGGDGPRLVGYLVHAAHPVRTAVFFHGNAGTAWRGRHFANALAEDGTDVLLAEYRGYGASEGSPSATGVRDDGEAALRWLLDVRHVAPSRLVVVGHSLGGAVGLAALARHRLAGGVLLSTFTTLHDMSREVLGFPLSWTVPDAWAFDSRAAVRHVHCPLAFFHGDADEVVPLALGRELRAAAAGPATLTVVPGGGHNLPGIDGLVRPVLRRLLP